jgi:serine/threonine protein kinase/tetratricopeptide (TPR) repeat protein
VTRSIALGAFDLIEPLGKGGMAEVWSGVHRREGVRVAVKVVTEPDIRRPVLQAALRNEVRAMARLDHPGIVMLIDQGNVGADTEERSAGALLAGSPYLVTELAPGGTAVPLCGRLSWRRVRIVLTALLEALAHAHARGVLHRDVKPSNVLLFDGEVKLSDFGLALDLEPDAGRTRRRGRVLGTPAYMAPEQFIGDYRDYGPPTDLYALGCLACALVSGAPPYGRGSDVDLMHELHLEAELPELEPRMPVPEGLDDWIAQLLEKKPSRRFQRAADALEVLKALVDPQGGHLAPLVDDFTTADALSSSVVTVHADLGNIDPWSRRPTLRDQPSVPPVAPPVPLPRSWRRAETPARPMALLGAGLGLFGLRPTPLVGRDRERDELWPALSDVVRQRERRLLLLEGPDGSGKSRLAQWLCERAHEIGVASVLKATHGAHGGPGHGLGPMLARELGCVGLERPELDRQLDKRLKRLGLDSDPLEAERDAIAELIAPAASDAERRVRFGSATERYVLVARLIRRMARQRAVILWLDDVEWDLDAVGLTHHLLFADTAKLPLLVMLTARLEAVTKGDEDGLYKACRSHPAARVVKVPTLPPSEWPHLVEQLLRLEPSLAARVAERTTGNPLFAVQLIGHWVDRDWLEAGPEGFRLKAGASVELPDALAAMWQRRIDQLLARRSDDEARALEIAAVLGETVDGEEWSRVLGLLGLEPPYALVEDLLARRLAATGDAGLRDGWSFVHELLREALEQRANQEGRAHSHHRLCARMLEAEQRPRSAERIARHLIAAGDSAAALAPMLEAAKERLETGDYAAVDALVSQREQTLVALRCDEADQRWAEGWVLRGELAARRGRFEVGMKWADVAVDAASEHDWPRLRAEALLLRAGVARMRGDSVAAVRDVGLALDLARHAEDSSLLSRALLLLGRVSMHHGKLVEAGECLHEARRRATGLGDQHGIAEADWALAHLAQYRASYDEAFELNAVALETLRKLGDRWAVARCINTAGELSRLQGRLEEAETYYREAAARMNALGALDAAAVCEANVARVLAERGLYAEARVGLERFRPLFEEQGRKNPLVWLHGVLLVCDAGECDWKAWDAHWAEVSRLLSETGYHDLDIATVIHMAGQLCETAGEPVRARAAYALAAVEWRAVGRDTEADRAEAAHARLARG